jgi:Cu+-exporting ATPase
MTGDRIIEGQAHEGHDHHHARHGHHPAAEAGKVKDPVCGMMVDPHATTYRAQYEGKPYYFCSSGCQSNFMAEPAKYAAPGARQAESVSEDLPDAPADPPGRSRLLPDLRHGARTRAGDGGDRPQP